MVSVAGLAADGRGLDARGSPILAFPHKGGRDLSLAIFAWFRVIRLFADFWIPAFAGMTGIGSSGGFSDCARRLILGGWVVRRLWIPAFAGMTGMGKRGARILSESGFTGLWDFQDSLGVYSFGKGLFVIRIGGVSRYVERRGLGEMKS